MNQCGLMLIIVIIIVDRFIVLFIGSTLPYGARGGAFD